MPQLQHSWLLCSSSAAQAAANTVLAPVLHLWQGGLSAAVAEQHMSADQRNLWAAACSHTPQQQQQHQ
jgi:hypothetical protein